MENIQNYLDEIKFEVIKERYKLEIKESSYLSESIFLIKPIYEISDFLKYDGEIFIKNLFKGLLNRDAKIEEIDNYLNLLNIGRDKIDILLKVRFSVEGKNNNIDVLGLKKRRILRKLENINFLGTFLNSFSLIFSLPKLLNKIDLLEGKVSGLENDIVILDKKLELKEFELYKIYEKGFLSTQDNLNFYKSELKEIDCNFIKIENRLDDLSSIKNSLNISEQKYYELENSLNIFEQKYYELENSFNNSEQKNKKLEEQVYNFKKAWFN